MLTKITLEFANAKAAKEFGQAANESLDGLAQSIAQMQIDKKTVALAWDESCDPTELFEALSSAVEEMDWEL